VVAFKGIINLLTILPKNKKKANKTERRTKGQKKEFLLRRSKIYLVLKGRTVESGFFKEKGRRLGEGGGVCQRNK